MAELLLSAIGEVCLARSVQTTLKEKGPDFILEHVQPVLKQADLVLGSLESVYMPPDFPSDKINNNFQALSSSVEMNQVLCCAGIDVINQATNHALDCGLEGLKYTSKTLKDSRFTVIGASDQEQEAYELKVVEKKGTKIGFLGYTDPFKWTLEGGKGHLAYFKKETVINQIKESRRRVDILIVSWHADLEFALAPSLKRFDLCHELVDAGADLIYCHHPHVPQGIEEYKEGLIVYSIGNFIFDIGPYQRKHSPQDAYRAVILNLKIKNKRIESWSRDYFKIDPDFVRPVCLNEEEKEAFQDHFDKIDTLVKDREKVRLEWHRISRYWLTEYWDQITEAGPDGFIDQWGWRRMTALSYMFEGINDMSLAKYKGFKNETFDWVRPYFPFETA